MPYKYLKPFRTLSNISWIHGASKEKLICYRNEERTRHAHDKFTSATTNKRKGKLFQTKHRCSDADCVTLEVPSNWGALPNPEGSTQIRKCPDVPLRGGLYTPPQTPQDSGGLRRTLIAWHWAKIGGVRWRLWSLPEYGIIQWSLWIPTIHFRWIPVD